MKFEKVTRWHASGLHLTISVAIAAGALALMLLVWYPHPLFVAAGGNDLLFILVGVDVVIGPLITLIIFRVGKKGLKFDLTVIGVLQLSALIYGVSIVYLARPAYIVFVKDRFEVVTAIELQPQNLAEAKYPQFRDVPVTGPVWVASDFPTDPVERMALLKLTLAGYDVQHFPRYYVPYEERAKEILAKAQTIERTRQADPKAARVVDEWLKSSGTSPDSVRYVDLRAPRYWVGVLLDAGTGRPVKLLIYDKI